MTDIRLHKLESKQANKMTHTRHGLSIGIERINAQFILTLKASGTLTHADYERIDPMVDSALENIKEPKVKVLLDASDLDGWELRAAWDDFQLALKHSNEFEKVAIYGYKKWQDLASRIGTWFMSGEMKHFEDLNDAYAWLLA